MTYTNIDQEFIDVVRAIMTHHVGKENRISRPLLLAKVRHFYPDATDRHVRDALSQTEIISSSGLGGYWMPANKAEVQAYLAELSSRQARIAERKRIITDWMVKKLDQRVSQPHLLEVNQ
jgi:hypothetical protein